MHIAHFAPSIWQPGGIAAYIRRLGAAQSKRGDRVTYLSLTPADGDAADTLVLDRDTDLSAVARRHGIDVVHLHKRVSAAPSVPAVRTMHGHQGSCPSGSRYLARTASPCDRAPGTAACLWGKVVDRCGSVRPQRIREDFARLRDEQRQARRIPTMTVSQFLREQMIRAGAKPSRLIAVPSPAPVVGETVDLPDGVPRFLFLGRFVPHKGVLWLLRAFAEMNTPAHLDLAGDGPLADRVRTFIDRHALGDHVTLHGWVDESAVEALIQQSRAVAFPSIWHEPAGLVSLEAAAHGRPLIGSHCGGIPEYAQPSFSLLVKPNDRPALTDALDALASDIARARQMGAAGRSMALHRFSMDRFLDRVDAVYREVLPVAVPLPARS
jgi:glycosyltransferase involved in cell wall biosynthesis